jgi:cytidylate kinase
MSKIIITIDGWSSCGKSTLAKQMARALGYIYIDSGAMYRAITLYFLRHHVDWTNPEQTNQALQQIQLHFEFNERSQQSDIHLNGENVEYLIRELVVAEKVSEVAAIAAVRDFAVRQQQQMGAQKGIIMDGRDIGTTVFPAAELKIFMTAEQSVRVQRRYQEMLIKNPNVTLEEVQKNLATRDHIDSNRAVSPLRKATDAILLDNTQMTMDEQLDYALKLASEKMQSVIAR